MPGLCLSTAANDETGGRHGELGVALAALQHFDWYDHEVIVEREPCALGYTTYPGYPTSTIERDDVVCYVEGEVYDGATTDDLATVAARLLDPDASDEPVGEWLASADGEFLLCAVDRRSGDVAVLNDLFGRLPVYYARTDDGVVLSREPQFLLDRIDYTFDRRAIAQVLLFNYTLGQRTLWNEVRTLPPATALFVRDGSVTFDSLHEFDFEGKRHADRSLRKNARTMAALFVDACRARSSARETNVVSLSGGHDSRTVAAAFHAAELPFETATFVRPSGDGSKDVEIASEVAEALGVEWHRYELPPLRGQEMKTLLEIKAGLNHLGMSHLLPFLQQLRDRCGPQTAYYTGDGGDKAVPDLSPPRTFDDLSDLVDYTVTKNSVFSPAEAAGIVGLDETDVRATVRRVLGSYPETNLADKYVHFLVHERGFNWLFEGEDRNRYFLWSTSPFYSPAFFRYAMNVPDEQKSKNRLYREFLSALWRRGVEFDDADFGTPMSSSRYTLVQYGLELLDRHPWLESIVQDLYRGELLDGYHPNASRLLREQLARCDALGDVLDRSRVEDVADNRNEYGFQEFYALLSVTSAINDQTCGRDATALADGLVLER